MPRRRTRSHPAGLALLAALLLHGTPVFPWTQPFRARGGVVVCQDAIAARVGADVLRDGGTAVDAAVATAFALAVTHPAAGNIGGGGFMIHRPAAGGPVAYDFRETAPAAATPDMWLRDGVYDPDQHHESHLSVGVPGTVAGLHLAWKEGGKLPWKRLVEPAVVLARDGFVVGDPLARSLREFLPKLERYPASLAQFTKGAAPPAGAGATGGPSGSGGAADASGRPTPPGEPVPWEIGDVLVQPDLARTLARIAENGPAGFYEGDTALLIEREMKRGGGIITREDLKAYAAKKRVPIRGNYRGYEVIGMPPPSSGGIVTVEVLNILEGYKLSDSGFGSALTVHRMAEAMRRAFADRARWLGDPEFNPGMPVARLISKPHAAALRRTIDDDRATPSSPSSFEWESESPATTHISVVDAAGDAVSLTYTLEERYGSGIVVPGAGFLLNNEMGDFNPVPGLTDESGKIGTPPNLTAPGKRMLSSMSPTILAKDGRVFMVLGSPGGRTIINTVIEVILDVVDFGMNVQEAVDAPRFHHQWLPDRILAERFGLSPDTVHLLESRGHKVEFTDMQGTAQAIVFDPKTGLLEAGADRRDAGSAAAAP